MCGGAGPTRSLVETSARTDADRSQRTSRSRIGEQGIPVCPCVLRSDDRTHRSAAISRGLDQSVAGSCGGTGCGGERGHRVSLRSWTAGIDAPCAPPHRAERPGHTVVPPDGTAAERASWEVRPTGCWPQKIAGAAASIASRVLTPPARVADTAGRTRPDLSSSAHLADADR